MSDREVGLYKKYNVTRVADFDGKHENCEYFVMDPRHDLIARQVLEMYAQLAETAGYAKLPEDIRAMIERSKGEPSAPQES